MRIRPKQVQRRLCTLIECFVILLDSSIFNPHSFASFARIIITQWDAIRRCDYRKMEKYIYVQKGREWPNLRTKKGGRKRWQNVAAIHERIVNMWHSTTNRRGEKSRYECLKLRDWKRGEFREKSNSQNPDVGNSFPFLEKVFFFKM